MQQGDQRIRERIQALLIYYPDHSPAEGKLEDLILVRNDNEKNQLLIIVRSVVFCCIC